MRFYLFDGVTAFASGVHARGVKNVGRHEEFLVKHYDRDPQMPAPLIIESLAQLGGWMITTSSDYAHLAIMVMIKGVQVSGTAGPGDQVQLDVELINLNEYGAAIQACALIDQQEIVRASITYALYQVPENERDDLRQRYQQLARTPA